MQILDEVHTSPAGSRVGSAGRSFTSLDHWVDVARLLDDAGFDFLFFADGYGYPVLDGDLSRTSART